MKIINETAEEIGLESRSTGLRVFAAFFVLIGIAFCFIRSNTGASPLLIWTIGGVIILVGLLMLLFSASYSIDITKNTIHYVRKALAGSNRNVDQTYNSGDVARVIVQSSMDRRQISYQTFLVFKDGNIIPIDNSNSGGGLVFGGINISSGSKEIGIAQKVATFLGVPMQSGQTVVPPIIGTQL